MLSGASQLSSTVTKVSKKLQVLRASTCRKAVCDSLSVAGWRSTGRLIHQATTGAQNHSSSTGAAIGSADGCSSASATAEATASTGEHHILTQLLPMSVLLRDRPEARHSSRWRRVASMRQPVRTIASRLNQAS